MKYTLISTLVIAFFTLSCGGNGNGDEEAAQGNDATTAPGAATTANVMRLPAISSRPLAPEAEIAPL